MSVTYGFYDSVDNDRRYNALQMSSIFDGIIKDGVFMSIGARFEVTAKGTDMFVTVDSGRAWFNHTWTLNDSLLPIEIPQSELLLDRYDAIVLEVNSEINARENSIKIVKGKPASNPVYPTLTNSLTIHQYPLAYIYVKKGVTSIRQANITPMVGKDTTPYVTGIIDTINIESMVKQWEDQWSKFFEEQTNDMNTTNNAWKEQWTTWFEKYTKEMNQAKISWDARWREWYDSYTSENSQEFDDWTNEYRSKLIEFLNELDVLLSDDVAANLTSEIIKLKNRIDYLEKHAIMDNNK